MQTRERESDSNKSLALERLNRSSALRASDTLREKNLDHRVLSNHTVNPSVLTSANDCVINKLLRIKIVRVA